MVWIAAVCIAVAVGAVVYAIVPHGGGNTQTADKLLNRKLASSDSVLTKYAVRSADRALKATSRNELSVKLSVAGIEVRPAEWVVLRMVPAALLFTAFLLFSGWVAACIGGIIGCLMSYMYLRIKVSKARKRFEEDLPELLQLVAGSLRSGMSLVRSLEVAAEGSREPMVSEIRRALAHNRVGVVLEDSFEELADRMASQDFEWVALAIRIQKEVGGNLAEVLTSTADTIRERAYIVRQVNTLSAEGRLSAYILMALPFGVAGAMMVFNPTYLQPLWTEPMGWGILASVAVMLTVGWFWMKSVVRIEA